MLLLMNHAMAAPLSFDKQLEGTVYYPEDATPETATFQFSYQYPQIIPASETDTAINQHFAYLMSDMLSFTIPLHIQDVIDSALTSAYINLTYEISCNNDEYFSVLIHQEKMLGAAVNESNTAYVFKRNGIGAGMVLSIADILGLSSPNDDDGFSYERATQKADDLVYELVWDIIAEHISQGDLSYFEGLSIDDLKAEFYPENDFYLDSDSNVVFFIQPALIAANAAGTLTFSFSIEELLSEL